MTAKRGRPRKVRPNLGDPIAPGMSLRDIEAATGVRRSFLRQCLAVAAIPDYEADALIESDGFEGVSQLVNLGRRRTGKSTEYTRCCPHCGMPLRIEDAR